jgi:hypothetical protein
MSILGPSQNKNLCSDLNLTGRIDTFIGVTKDPIAHQDRSRGLISPYGINYRIANFFSDECTAHARCTILTYRTHWCSLAQRLPYEVLPAWYAAYGVIPKTQVLQRDKTFPACTFSPVFQQRSDEPPYTICQNVSLEQAPWDEKHIWGFDPFRF